MSNLDKRLKIKGIEEYNQKFKLLKEDFIDIFISNDDKKNPFKELLEIAKKYKLDYKLSELEDIYIKIEEDSLYDLNFIEELIDELKSFDTYIQENIDKETRELSKLQTLNKDEKSWTNGDSESFKESQKSLSMYEDLLFYCNGILVKKI